MEDAAKQNKLEPALVAFLVSSSFLGGVFFSSLGWTFYFSLPIVFIFFGVYLYNKKYFNLKYFSVIAVSFVFGFFYYNFYLNLRNNNEIIFDKKINFSGIIISEPVVKEKFQEFHLRLNPPFSGKIKVLASPFFVLNYGDVLSLEGEIKKPQSKIDFPLSFFPKIRAAESGGGNSLKRNLLTFKRNLISEFKKFLPPLQSALLSGITFGYRGDFPKDFKEKMALSGTTHIVALSGYNIAILVMTIGKIFSRWFKRRTVFYLTVITIFAFVVMVGAEASVVRAAIMGFLLLLAGETGRIYSMRNAMTFAAALMVLFDPTILVFDLSFELSFLSLLGIVYLTPVIKSVLKIKESGFLESKEIAATTISAQLMVIPFLIHKFDLFSLTSIFANVFILIFIPFTMFLGFVLGGLGLLFDYFGYALAFLAKILLNYEIKVIELFSLLRVPINLNFNPLIVFSFYYLILLAFIIRCHKNNGEKNRNA